MPAANKHAGIGPERVFCEAEPEKGAAIPDKIG